MAYIIVKNNKSHKIAANDADKNDLNVSYPPYEAKDITDAEFAKIIKNEAIFECGSDGTITVTDQPTQREIGSKDELLAYLEHVKKLLNAFIKAKQTSKSLYSTAQTYLATLNSHDYDSMTFPLNKTWEKYCADNSITYLHPLQIP